MDTEELKIRQLANQYLIYPADMMAVVHDLCGIQAQFMVNAFHSLRIRCSDYSENEIRDKMVKNWTIRGTVHIFAEEDLPLFLHCNNGADYRRNEWSGSSFWNQREQWALKPERQKFLSEVILSALEKEMHTREELKEMCREKGMTEAEESSMFDQWGGGIRELCERGFMNYVVQEKKAYCLCPTFTPIPEEKAKLELARLYFTNIAPATIRDAMYFFHETKTQITEWLRQLPVESAECRGKVYYYIENGKKYNDPIPEIIFLAGFDQMMLGYEKKESLYLPEDYMRGIFSLSGIVMPAVLLRGKVVGRWRRKNKKVVFEMFEQVSKADRDKMEEVFRGIYPEVNRTEWGVR